MEQVLYLVNAVRFEIRGTFQSPSAAKKIEGISSFSGG